MTRMDKALVLSAGLLLSAAFGPGAPPAAAKSKKPTALERLKFMSQPQLNLRSFDFDPETPLESRIGPAPAFIVDMMRQFDQRPDYEGYDPTPGERALLAGYINGLPAGMRKVFQERLVGFFFIKPFMGNGMGNWLVDDKGKVFSTIILNPAGFERSLSEVLTGREASVFKGDANVRFDCGDKERGILYTLLHEGTHAYDYIRGITPYTDSTVLYMLREGRGEGAKWDVWEDYSKPRKDADFPLRSKLRFYGFGEPLIEPKDAVKLYFQLADSPFATLYGSQSWAEDAAELAVFHHITRILKQPCAITFPAIDSGTPNRFSVLETEPALGRSRRIYQKLEK
ncbi:MAG: hypothetical protein WC943_09095 [Elusimicrobiota bacterium]|jgi:hypothetical protein